VILDMHVPAIFTSYDQKEADEDYALLQSLNAATRTSGPVLNPVRVVYPLIAPFAPVDDPFYHINMYAVCFKGRSRMSLSL
jgi:hypothetical protein